MKKIKDPKIIEELNNLVKNNENERIMVINKYDLEKIKFDVDKFYKFVLKKKQDNFKKENIYIEKGWYEVGTLKELKYLEEIILEEFPDFELSYYKEKFDKARMLSFVKDDDPESLKELFKSSELLMSIFVTYLHDEKDINIYLKYINYLIKKYEISPSVLKINYFRNKELYVHSYIFSKIFHPN